MIKILEKNAVSVCFACVLHGNGQHVHGCLCMFFVTMAYYLYDMGFNFINIWYFEFSENMRPKKPLIDSSPLKYDVNKAFFDCLLMQCTS